VWQRDYSWQSAFGYGGLSVEFVSFRLIEQLPEQEAAIEGRRQDRLRFTNRRIIDTPPLQEVWTPCAAAPLRGPGAGSGGPAPPSLAPTR
jgi:hypothetical protein